MNAPSNANTSGLEVVAWRRHDVFRKGAYFADRKDTAAMWAEQGLNPEPLVTAASAQARIDAAEARADRAEARISEIATMFGVCDGRRYLNDWKARLAALQQETQP